MSSQFQNQRRRVEEEDAKRRAKTQGYPYLDLISVRVPTELKAMALVPEEKAKVAGVCPLQLLRKKLALAALDGRNPDAQKIIQDLGRTYDVKVVIVSQAGIEHAWSYYQYVTPESKHVSGRVEIDEARLSQIYKETATFGDLAGKLDRFSGKTSDLLEAVLGGAMALGSSDIHLEPAESAGALRLRIDGLLHSVYQNFDPKVYKSLVTRVKLLSNLKLNISKEPQDGRFTIDLEGRDVEIRTSLIPSEYGETVVLRILDPSALKAKLEDLGWRADDLEIVKAEISKPNGLILNTGPTGSGKTTTLYAFLQSVYKPEIKVITIEDPIEYHLEGISQTQVDEDRNYTFASGLRSILRQDPDVILIGEIRDGETAGIALNAALTGHLVFSTLHTNDAIGAVPRLYELGSKPQTLGPALSLVIAQRLVRVLCEKCKKPAEITPELQEKISKFMEGLPERVDRSVYSSPTAFEPGQCEECGDIGYKGRTSVFELFQVSEAVEELIYTQPTESDIKRLARKEGMVTMMEDGILKVLQGKTSFAEIERLVGKISWLKSAGSPSLPPAGE